MTLIEVLISAGIATSMMMATAAAFAGNARALGTARTLSSGTIFLESVLEDLGAQPYANLLALDGSWVVDGESEARSQFRADLRVFQTGLDLVQLRVVLTDLQSGNELGRVAQQRSNT